MFQIMIHLKRRLYKIDYSTFQHIVIIGGGCGGGGVCVCGGGGVSYQQLTF